MKEVYEALNVLEKEIEKLLKELVLLLIDLDQIIKENEEEN